MVNSDPNTEKGEQTRRHIFKSALSLFRENGFDATTMQQAAGRAKVLKSAAYYYFPSKESIVQAYYEVVQAEQERICAKAFSAKIDLKPRLAVAMQSMFDLAKSDRNLLGVSFAIQGNLSTLGTSDRASGSLSL